LTVFPAAARTVLPMTTNRTLLAVDGNSLAHRAYHALSSSNLHDRKGRPSWAIKGFFSLLLGVVDRVDPSAIVIGFDDPNSSVRKTALPDYKAQRGEKNDTLRSQLAAIPEVLTAAGFKVVIPDGLEADDVTASAGQWAAQAGWNCVIATSDRDAFAHISNTTSVLRIINGGIENSPLLNEERFFTMNGIRPDQYLDYAALRGDTSDNLPGVRGIGPKTASKLLFEMGSMDLVWADLKSGGAGIAAAAGKACVTKLRAEGAYDAWKRNTEIMSAVMLEPSVTLADPSTPGHLPLVEKPLTAALMDYDLRSIANAARQRLTAAQPPAPQIAPTPTQGEWAPPLEEPPYDPMYDSAYAPPSSEPAWSDSDHRQPAPARHSEPEPAGVGSGGGLHPAAYISGF
jgi:5'-3' exonuclease